MSGGSASSDVPPPLGMVGARAPGRGRRERARVDRGRWARRVDRCPCELHRSPGELMDLFEVWPELRDVPRVARAGFRAELRRIPGPVFKAGPRGYFRPHVLRCGLCQGWAPYSGTDLRAWTWSAEHGTTHRRCELWRARRSSKRDTMSPIRPVDPDAPELDLDAPKRERRRRRGSKRRGRELAPWDGPAVLATTWGDELAVIGASVQGLGVLVAPLPELRGRTVRAHGVELAVRYVHQEAPRWWALRELKPAR